MNALVPITARFDPFAEPLQLKTLPGYSIAEIVDALPNLPEAFVYNGVVLVGGELCARERWRYVRPKAFTTVTLQLLPNGGGEKKKNLGLTIAAIAVLAGVAFIASGGLSFLGAPVLFGQAFSFAGGGLGANLAAGLFGAAGSFAIKALTPPPVVPRERTAGTPKSLATAGIGGNGLKIGDEVPAVLGSLRVSPPFAVMPYTTFENGVMYAHGIYQLKGEYLLEDIYLDDVPISYYEEAEVETRSGTTGDALLTLNDTTVIEQQVGTQLSNAVVEGDDTIARQLVHQSSPDQDLPQWLYFRSAGTPDEIRMRLFFPGGIYVQTGAQAVVPIRIELKHVEDDDWDTDAIKLPTLHIQGRQEGKQIRQQIRLIFGAREDTGYTSFYTHYETFGAWWKTAPGETFEYEADESFWPGLRSEVEGPFEEVGIEYSYMPDMVASTGTHPTLGTTVTASSSSEVAGAEAWRAFDYSAIGTAWVTVNTVTAATLRVDYGVGAQVVLRGYCIRAQQIAIARKPKDWTFEGSNDGSSWTVLDTRTGWTDGNAWYYAAIPVANWAPYRYYRVNATTSNTTRLAIQHLLLFRDAFSDAGSQAAAIQQTHYTRGVNLSGNGADIYLDPVVFPAGEYEVRIKRGIAFSYTDLNFDTYAWNGSTANAYFFDHQVVSFVHAIPYAQYNVTSECYLETFATHSDDYPLNVNTDGVALISVKIPNKQIKSISVKATSIVPTYDPATEWSVKAASNNPAALFRHVLLGRDNAKALPGEIVDEDNMVEFWDRCVDAGFECNFVADGLTADQVLQIVAAAGWAVPKQAGLWGVILEKDRSGDAVQQLFSRRNCKSYGHSIDFPDPPDAIRAEYADEENDWKLNEVLVYRTGYDATNAVNIIAITYTGITNADAAEARALMDLRQMLYRAVTSEIEIFKPEGIVSSIGDIVGLSDDVLVKHHAGRLIEDVIRDGSSNITGLVLEAPVDFGAAAGEVETRMMAAVRSMPPTGKPSTTMAEINETSLTDEVTFATPLAPDSTIVRGALVTFGVYDQVFLRKRIFEIKRGRGTVRLTLKDDASELIHAA
jgi:hypothetical protein